MGILCYTLNNVWRVRKNTWKKNENNNRETRAFAVYKVGIQPGSRAQNITFCTWYAGRGGWSARTARGNIGHTLVGYRGRIAVWVGIGNRRRTNSGQ